MCEAVVYILDRRYSTFNLDTVHKSMKILIRFLVNDIAHKGANAH